MLDIVARPEWKTLLWILCHAHCVVQARTLSVYLVPPIRFTRAVSHSKVDGFVLTTQSVNLRIVGQPEWKARTAESLYIRGLIWTRL